MSWGKDNKADLVDTKEKMIMGTDPVSRCLKYARALSSDPLKSLVKKEIGEIKGIQ